VIALIGIIFVVVGGIIFGVGLAAEISHSNFEKNGEKAQAIIVDKDSYSQEVWIKYSAGGEIYSEKLNVYSSGMEKNERIDIHYDPENPSTFKVDSRIFETIFLNIGGFFLLLGIVFIVIPFVKSHSKKQLKAHGERLEGRIINIVINPNVMINGSNPYRADCEVTDPSSGEIYLYRTDNITEDISDFEGMTVNVYVDMKNKKRYFVDIYELIEKYNSINNIHDYR
jgi:hypothetical protein